MNRNRTGAESLYVRQSARVCSMPSLTNAGDTPTSVAGLQVLRSRPAYDVVLSTFGIQLLAWSCPWPPVSPLHLRWLRSRCVNGLVLIRLYLVEDQGVRCALVCAPYLQCSRVVGRHMEQPIKFSRSATVYGLSPWAVDCRFSLSQME